MTKRFAKVVAGVVEHICVAEKAEDVPERIELDDVADAEIGIGDLHNGIVFSKKPPPEKTAEELAAEAEEAARKELRTEAKASAMFKALEKASLADIGTWVNTNFPSMDAQQRAFLKMLAAGVALYLRGR